MSNSTRILVKLLPTAALAAAGSRRNLRPLFDADTADGTLGIAAAPSWYLADLPVAGITPWDSAHAQIAQQLGIDESNVIYAEPDFANTLFADPQGADNAFALGENCQSVPQQDSYNRAKGPDEFAWHLRNDFSQLGAARDAVQFSDPRTRIAHIDTGYDKTHQARPERILTQLERNFASGNNQPNDAQDPNRGYLFDNSGHGTGTIGILAGGPIPAQNGKYLGGAPQADIVPLRIADSVVMFYTSAFVQSLKYATQQGCDVVSISMGGLPSRAWNEAVNAAYEAGVCIVAASGDCFGGLPTHHVVYPARYRRVIAACGVMANGAPYYDLPIKVIEGSWGPNSCMTAALSSYTPNIPWPKFGCAETINLDGQGTSACTPQIAAAAALWYEKYKNYLPRDWRRVEAVRHALFRSAKAVPPEYQEKLGRGILQAKAALDITPNLNLPETPPDNDWFPFFRVITGLGISATPAREMMFNLELTQRWLLNRELQELVPEPESELPRDAIREFMDAAIADEQASQALRQHLASRYSLLFGASAKQAAKKLPTPQPAARQLTVQIPKPPFRRLRAYAVDPSFSTKLDTAAMNEAVLKVRWEDLLPGPKGEYLEVIDTEAPSGFQVNLNEPMLLAQDGFEPSEGNPGFHQQMVYAVAMTTIEFFERALGRPVLWRPEPNPDNEFDDHKFVRQLKIHPHALRQANAFYSPQKISLLFGYFEVSDSDPGEHVPGSIVYSCLSHDIIAHETTHAILDGMHRRFNEATNPDVLALHEAFADIVALMQHFTIPAVLETEISRTRGNLEEESTLGKLAVQFGRAMGGRGALRDAIGRVDKNGVWTRQKPDPADYQKQVTPHERGALLVAAVFDAFLAIYKSRTSDLLRIYTGGTGILPSGAIHPDLVRRLAAEAAKSASHVLNMSIRALDYMPPVDVTFGEYLRGLITADFDMVADDPLNYRVAFVEAFRRRGIYPPRVETLSVDTLRWQGLDLNTLSIPDQQLLQRHLLSLLKQLRQYADACFYLHDRKDLFLATRKQRALLCNKLKLMFADIPSFAILIGLDPNLEFEVHELRRSMRVSPDGKPIPQVVVALTQLRPLDGRSTDTFRGGVTLIVDLSKPAIQYAIKKNINSETREKATRAFLQEAQQDPLRALLLAPQREEPFAALHLLSDLSG